MANEITLVFPHQLFRHSDALDKNRPVMLVEEWLFFRQYSFHKNKLILHRASMQWYASWLTENNYAVEYINSSEVISDCRRLIPALKNRGVQSIHLAYPADDWLERRLRKTCKDQGILLVFHSSPNFLNQPEDLHAFFEKKKTYFQTDFYIWQRKQRKILLGSKGEPEGGKWTYDAENRLKVPKGLMIPPIRQANKNKFVDAAIEHVKEHFKDNPGHTDQFIYPVTHTEADRWLELFLQERLKLFGDYEDAMVVNENFLFHSVLTPILNIGLLDPSTILERVLDVRNRLNIPLNALEGFIRQVMGWREFIHIVYVREGRKQRTRNYWNFTRKIPQGFYSGTTGITPIDKVIRKLLDTGYNHHIERLMVLGNFMLLCEFDPDEVYKWFMEMYIDSYDWVMVPNVYGMTQFADGGLMTTKPYISGSNYLMKMGDWPKGPWQEIWDGLFWRFMHVHRDFFLSNPRLGMLVKTFDKMPEEKKQKHLRIAENFLQQLDDRSSIIETN
nr:cryptochrome/photolyase family protein [Flavihumibacter rivuli]